MWWVILITFMGLTGCIGPFAPECSTQAVPALSVAVVDSLTGESLFPGATVWVRDGAFVDTLGTWGGGEPYVGPMERAGTYVVMVGHPGYMAWQLAGVRVHKDRCHPITRKITARLVPQS